MFWSGKKRTHEEDAASRRDKSMTLWEEAASRASAPERYEHYWKALEVLCAVCEKKEDPVILFESLKPYLLLIPEKKREALLRDDIISGFTHFSGLLSRTEYLKTAKIKIK